MSAALYEVVSPWAKVEYSRWSQEAIAPTVACRSLAGAGLLIAYGAEQSEVFDPGGRTTAVVSSVNYDSRQDLPSQEKTGAEITGIDCYYGCIELL